jgi:hypothetical protein
MMMMPNNMLAQRLGLGGQMQPQAYPQPMPPQMPMQPMVNRWAGPPMGGQAQFQQPAQMPMQAQAPMNAQGPMQPQMPQQPMQAPMMMPQNTIRHRLGL